jgi:ubiquinone/menaquinone biosynthesis C-methylase UbiE
MADGKQEHKHHGKSTRDILDPKKILGVLELKEGQTFMDAGCGDGYISIAASELVKESGKIYSVDAYQPSLDGLNQEAKKLQINNLKTVLADMTIAVPLENNLIDVCVMANVLHGFTRPDTLKTVLTEIRRVLKQGGTFAVVDFIKADGPPGPSYDVRLTPEDVEKILEEHGFTIGGTAEVGKYHYLVKTFKK